MVALPAYRKDVICTFFADSLTPKSSDQQFSRSTKMRFAHISASWMNTVYFVAAATASIDSNQVVNVGDDTTLTSGSGGTPTRTTFPRTSSLINPFDGMTTPLPGVVSIHQGNQQIEQGPDGVKTVINGDQTIIDGPKGRTVINGDQTIVQTKTSDGGQTMIQIDGESTGGAAMATQMPLAGVVMVAGGAMMLF